MPALHLIFSPEGERHSRSRRAPDDQVLLLQDGVLADPASTQSVQVLTDDAIARGIAFRFSTEQLIDWNDFVRLTETCSPVVSWP